MPTKFQDYYETLGVSRDATADEIQAAFRRKARKHHPDVNKTAGAEDTFKELNEAYEVLRDPEKRKRYDQLGANWRAGQDFTPPPGGGGARAGGQGGGFGGFDFNNGDFSDFFESLFGARGGGGARGGPRRGDDAEAEIAISLEDAYHGTQRSVRMDQGRGFDVTIPAGTRSGDVLRLAGQGSPGVEGGASGDIYLHVRLDPHPHFRIYGANLETDVAVSPWEAVLGAKIPVETLDGVVQTTLPAGTSCGKRLRLRGQGLPDRDAPKSPAGYQPRGDLYARVRIEVPRTLTDRERTLCEELRGSSQFDPRK